MISKGENNYSNSTYGISYGKLKYHSLHHAIYDRRVTQVKLLLKIQPELINFRTNHGLTPLMIACLQPESEKRNHIMRLLIKAPLLNPYCRDRGKRSVIFYFINYLKLEHLKEFLQFSNFNYFTQTDIDGYTILHYAVFREDLEILEFIINIFSRYKISIEIPSKTNLTPLLLACKFSKYRSIALIIKMGGNNFNVRDNEFFRNCVEWLEYHKENKLITEDNKLFYFDKFEIEYDSRSEMSVCESFSSRSHEIKPLSARVQNSISKNSAREYSFLGISRFKSNPSFISKLENDEKIENKSISVLEIENMSVDDVEEFVMDSLKHNKRKLTKAKRVSIVINDRVFLPRKNTITIDNLPLCRETSANIAHRLLNKMAIYYS